MRARARVADDDMLRKGLCYLTCSEISTSLADDTAWFCLDRWCSLRCRLAVAAIPLVLVLLPQPHHSRMLSSNLRRVTAATSIKRAQPSLLRHRTPRTLHFPAAHNAFSTSSRRQQETPKSPFQTFVDVLRDEIRKNRELQDNVKQLQGDVDKLQDTEAMKRAREAYERARVCIHFGFDIVDQEVLTLLPLRS
jgi:hypothetical protein